MTRIGVLSDSHGRAARTRVAVQLLVEHGVDLLVHLGDVEREEVLEALLVGSDAAGKLIPPVRMVFGNVDEPVASLVRYAELLGIEVDHPVGRINVDGKSIVFTHGDRTAVLSEAVKRGVDYLLHGHTHHQRDQRIGKTRVINPGALHRAGAYSVAVLDVGADDLRFLPVPD